MNSSKSVKLASKHFYKILVLKPLLKNMSYKCNTEFLVLDKSRTKIFGKEVLLLEVESKNNKYKDVIVFDNKETFESTIVGKRAMNLSIVGFDGTAQYYVVNCGNRFKSLVLVQKIVDYWFKCLVLNILAIMSIILCIYACVFWLANYLL